MPRSLRTPHHLRLQDLLTDLRKSKHLSQTELAQRLGRPQSFVAKYEGGERRIDVIEFIEVVRALGGDPTEVLAQLCGS